MLERIGNCRIVEEIASGGMAVVYRAVQDPLGRTVAIKALKSSAATEENVSTRFEREAKSLANLQHENIIHVYDFHRERGALFIVMEYVQGIDLYDLLELCAHPARTKRPPSWRCRSRAPSTTRTSGGSSTATSSPRTSCCRHQGEREADGLRHRA